MSERDLEDRIRKLEQRLVQVEGQLSFAAEAVQQLRALLGQKIDSGAVVDITAHLEEDAIDANRAIGSLEAAVENLQTDLATKAEVMRTAYAVTRVLAEQIAKRTAPVKKKTHVIHRDEKTHRVTGVTTTEEY